MTETYWDGSYLFDGTIDFSGSVEVHDTVDHKQAMLDCLLMQFVGKSKIESIVSVLGERLNGMESALTDLEEKRWLNKAEGVQLDGLGNIVSQLRLITKAIALPFFGFADQLSGRGFGVARFRGKDESNLSSARLADPEYRRMIAAKTAKNVSCGLAEEVIVAYQNIFDASKIILMEMGNASMRIGIGNKLNETDIVFTKALNLFIKPSGVRIDFKMHFDASNIFGFREQGYQGFGAPFADIIN